MYFNVSESRLVQRLLGLVLLIAIAGCASSGNSGDVRGNDNGSVPVNENEAIEYQKAINRCTRTGGTRVVKIKGELRCY